MVHARRLLIVTIAAGFLSILGAYVFRTQIAASAGTGFSQLSTQQVRYYQNQKSNSAGLLSLFQACYPVLGALGTLGFLRVSRWYVLPIALACTLSLQNPGRLFTVSLIVQMAIVYAYLRHSQPRAQRPSRSMRARSGHARLYALAGGGIATSLYVFIWLGDKLGKNQITTNAVNSSLPKPLVSPLLYLTGGLPAMSSATATHSPPFEGHGSSAFVLVRLWHIWSPQGTMPGTIGNFIDNPYSFNVFTGFGQAYWDGGYLWVLALSLTVGTLAVFSHRSALAGSLPAMWVSSLVGMLMISLPMQHRLLNLDTIFQLALGIALMRIVQNHSRQETFSTTAQDPVEDETLRGSHRHTKGRTAPGIRTTTPVSSAVLAAAVVTASLSHQTQRRTPAQRTSRRGGPRSARLRSSASRRSLPASQGSLRRTRVKPRRK